MEQERFGPHLPKAGGCAQVVEAHPPLKGKGAAPHVGVRSKGKGAPPAIPENEKWFMPIPLVIYADGGKVAYTTVAALGPRTPVSIQLPVRPTKVELDPDMWVLSDKTTIQKR
jgi:hypothetical protein